MKIEKITIEVQLKSKKFMEIKTSVEGRDENQMESEEIEIAALKIGNILATSIREIMPDRFF